MLADASLDYFAETGFQGRQRRGVFVRHDLSVSGLGEAQLLKPAKSKVMNGSGAASSNCAGGLGWILPLLAGFVLLNCDRLRGRQQRIGPPRHSTPKLTTELDPATRFFRQTKAGDWDSVFSSVRDALETLKR